MQALLRMLSGLTRRTDFSFYQKMLMLKINNSTISYYLILR